MIYPSTLEMRIRMHSESLVECLERLFQWFEHIQETDRKMGLQIPLSGKMKSGTFPRLLSKLSSVKKQKDSAIIAFSGRLRIYVTKFQHRENSWTFEFLNRVDKMSPEEILETLENLHSCTKYFLERYKCTFARIWRTGNSEMLFPVVRLIDERTHAILVNSKKLDYIFETPEVFWNYPWESIDRFGDNSLVTRAMKAASNVEYVGAVFDHQWEMARVAKPNMVEYYGANPRGGEMDIFQAGVPRMQDVGYNESEKSYVYTCDVTEDEHILPREIIAVRKLVLDQKLEDGSTVEVVKIVFQDEAMAKREKRPLLDVGAKVFYRSEGGEIVELTE